MILMTLESIEDEDDRAFMLQLYEQYSRLIRKTIYCITHDPESIEDLIQDTYEKLIKKIPTIRSFECHKMTAYVVYTSRSAAINYIKHRDVVTKHVYYGDENDFSEILQGPPDGFEEQSIHRLDVDTVLGKVSKLPEAQKDILFFKYFLEMTDDEIAEIMCMSAGNVRQSLRRARNAAKTLLTEGVKPNE